MNIRKLPCQYNKSHSLNFCEILQLCLPLFCIVTQNKLTMPLLAFQILVSHPSYPGFAKYILTFFIHRIVYRLRALLSLDFTEMMRIFYLPEICRGSSIIITCHIIHQCHRLFVLHITVILFIRELSTPFCSETDAKLLGFSLAYG